MTKLNVKGSRKRFFLSAQTVAKKIARATPRFGDLLVSRKKLVSFDAILDYEFSLIVNTWAYLHLDVGDILMVISKPIKHGNFGMNKQWLIQVLDVRRQQKSHIFVTDLKQKMGAGDLSIVSRFGNTEP